MLTRILQSWLVGAWVAAVALMVGVSVAVDAKFSTTALLFVLGVSPAVVIAVLAGAASPPTVAEILYRAHEKDGRP